VISDMGMLGRSLIGIGLALAIIGVVLIVGERLGLHRLPGDIVYRRGGITAYFPIVSCLIISAILTLILNLVFRRR